MILRALSGTLSLVAAVLVSTAAANACDDKLAQSFDAQITGAHDAKAWATMNEVALRLAGLYDGCAASENGRRYYEDTMRMASALLSAGAADLERHNDAGARRPFTVAHSLYHTIVADLDAPSDVKDDARQHAAFLEKSLPWLVAVPVDPGVMPRAHAAAARAAAPVRAAAAPPVQPESEFDVVETWTTPFTGPYRTFHVKLNLHPVTTTAVVATDFRMIVSSRAYGRQMVYGRPGAAPAYRKTDWTSASSDYKLVPTVDPSEDLGAQGAITLQAGGALTRVVTFVIHSDSDMTAETVATLTWNHR